MAKISKVLKASIYIYIYIHITHGTWESSSSSHNVRAQATHHIQPTVEVWEWISNFVLHFIMDVITYQYCECGSGVVRLSIFCGCHKVVNDHAICGCYTYIRCHMFAFVMDIRFHFSFITLSKLSRVAFYPSTHCDQVTLICDSKWCSHTNFGEISNQNSPICIHEMN